MKSKYLYLLPALLAPFVLVLNLAAVTKLNQSPATVNRITPLIGNSNIYAALPAPQPEVKGSTTTSDARPLILKNYFKYYNSDLYSLADTLVKIADEYKLDFRLLPAIAMQESNLCAHIPADSHNCWGYGIYGDQVVYFDSYEEGARRVAKTLAEDYISRGLVTPEEIMRRYTPPSTGSWADGVNLFIDIMEKGGIPEPSSSN